MVKKFDDAEEEAMEEMMLTMLEKEAKKEAQRWTRRFSAKPDMKEVLAAMTKDELNERKKMLKLKGAAALKKDELVRLVAEAILERAEVLFELLDETQHQWLRRICAAGGVVAIQEEAETHCLEWLYSIGWVAFGHVGNTRCVIMPSELTAVFQRIDGAELSRIAAENSQWIILASGLVYYYGVLSPKEMVARLTELTGTAVEEERLYAVVGINAAEGDWGIALEEDWFCDYRVWDPAALRQEQERYPDVTPYPFTYEQLYAAGQLHFVEQNAPFESLVQLLEKEWRAETDEAVEQVEEWVMMLRNGEEVGEVLAFIEESLVFPTRKLAKKMIDLLVALSNGTRQWALKGYAPQELRQLKNPDSNVVLLHKPTARQNQTGRNEPCPCGSGKKYKKCCAQKDESQ